MIKKAFYLLGSLLALVFFVFPLDVSAAELSGVQPPTIEGTLTSETGETSQVIGRLVEESPSLSKSSFSTLNNLDITEVEHSSTYAFSVYASPTKHTISASRKDGSLAVVAYVTISYFTKGTTPEQYKLSSVSASYSRQDPTVSIQNARVVYGSTGRFPEAIYDQSGTTYYTNSVFKQLYYSKYTIAQYGSVGARNMMDIVRGSGKWSLEVTQDAF